MENEDGPREPWQDHTLLKLGHLYFFLNKVWNVAPSLRQVMLRLHVPAEAFLPPHAPLGYNYWQEPQTHTQPSSSAGFRRPGYELIYKTGIPQDTAPEDSVTGISNWFLLWSGAARPLWIEAAKAQEIVFFPILKKGIFWLHYFHHSDSTQAFACVRRHQMEMEQLLTESQSPGNDKRFISTHQGVL